jgi:type IV secretion system protein VirB11
MRDKSEELEAKTVNLMLRPLQHFLDDDAITEMTINQPKEVWVKGFEGWECHNLEALTESHINSLITATYSYNNLREQAIGSLLMPDGSRCQVLRFPATLDDQVSFTIRKHSTVSFTLEQLEKGGAFNDWKDVSFNKTVEAASKLKGFETITDKDKELIELKADGKIIEFLKKCVLRQKNVVIAGKTGSGKTTFAKALITEIPSEERIVTIEDVHELHLPNHPNHLHMMFGSGQGRVTAFDALMSCMRVSPDRILLAELRGGETWEYLMSLNTGHPGGITTVHSNGAVHTFDRIAGLVKSSDVGRTVDMEAIKMILYSTVDVVLFFDKRKLKEVYFDPIFAKQTLNN